MKIEITLSEYEQVIKAVEWCVENLDSTKWSFATDWPLRNYKFVFLDKKDAVLFGLKWI